MAGRHGELANPRRLAVEAVGGGEAALLVLDLRHQQQRPRAAGVALLRGVRDCHRGAGLGQCRVQPSLLEKNPPLFHVEGGGKDVVIAVETAGRRQARLQNAIGRSQLALGDEVARELQAADRNGLVIGAQRRDAERERTTMQ